MTSANQSRHQNQGPKSFSPNWTPIPSNIKTRKTSSSNFNKHITFTLPPSLQTFNQTRWDSRTETQRRVPTFSRHDVLNATLSVRARETRSVPTCTDCSVVRLVQLKAFHTPMPTRRRELRGTMILCSSTSRTQRSIFQAQRWLSVD